MRVTGQYYRALSGHRDELASTSYELYTEASVSHTFAVFTSWAGQNLENLTQYCVENCIGTLCRSKLL